MFVRNVMRLIKQRKFDFAKDAIKITRAGLSLNPAQSLNFVDGDLFNNDELVSQGAVISSVAKTKTYDFANKKSASMVECPMILHSSMDIDLASPPNPTTVTGEVGQAAYDNLKLQDGVLQTVSTTVSGKSKAYVVELDLTDLVNKQGGLTRFKSLLTSIQVDAWTKGSGSNGGVAANGVDVKLWVSNSAWGIATGQNFNSSTTGTIAKITVGNNITYANYINSSNKLYILIASQYASDGTIASSVSLDYISVTIGYNERTVTNGDKFFVGGDTTSLDFNFSTKIANSVAECPMRFLYSGATTIQAPTGTWTTTYEGAQNIIDKLKIQDGTTADNSTLTNGGIEQYMIELDLTPLCNKLYGGSNSALKAALKSITADVWASGYGASGGVQTNGVNISLWYQNSSWSSGTSGGPMNSTSGSISKLNFYTNVLSSAQDRISSSNKLYILIASQYASDGVIASSVSLDYLNINIQLTRTPDTVQPITVNLPKYWAMVVKGWSPNYAYDVNKSGNGVCIADFIIDGNNRFGLWYNDSSDKFDVTSVKNGTYTRLLSNVQTFNKNQSYNIIFGVNANGMFLKLLKNNGTVESYSNTTTDIIKGICQLLIGQLSPSSTAYNADAFAETFTLVDLTNKPNGYSDAEAQNILQGVLPNPLGLVNPELFDITKVQLHANATLSNGVITLNATASYQSSSLGVIVLPNNVYEFKINGTGYINISQRPYVNIEAYYNNIKLSRLVDGLGIDTSKTISVTTPNNTNKLVISLQNNGAGTFTFSQISLKRKD